MSTVSSSNGTVQGVSSDGRSLVEGIVRSGAESNIVDKGWAFVCYDDTVTPTGAADVFCRIANLSSDNLIIQKVVGRSATADLWTFQTTANYTSATSHGDGPTPTNLRADKATANLFSAKGTFESDVDITGDAGSQIVGRVNVPILGANFEHANGMPLAVIPPGYSFLIEAVTGSFVVSYEVYCYFDQIPHVTD
jgi:hypothetical protein